VDIANHKLKDKIMNLDPNLENIAYKIVNKTNIKNETYTIDPITILMVISIILTLIRVLQECRSNRTQKDKNTEARDLKSTINNLCIKNNWLNNYRLNKIIKNHLSKKEYSIYGVSLKNAIMEVGKNLSDDESLTLLEATNV
jgi:ribosome biogenesis GTPase A